MAVSNSELVQGKRWQIWISTTSGATPATGSIIAYGTNASISIDADTIEASTKYSCNWRNASVGTAGYTIQSDSLYTTASGCTSFQTLMEIMLDADVAYWYMGEEATHDGDCSTNPHTLDTSKTYFRGEAAVTSLNLEASADDFVTVSATLTGNGQFIIED